VSTLEDWITDVAAELGITELGELVDPAFLTPLVLDMTRDVAHGVARPAAPITAYLLGLAVARAAGTGPGEPDFARARAAHLAALARARDPADDAPSADPTVGST